MSPPAEGRSDGGRERLDALIAFLQQEQQRIHAAEYRHRQQLDDLQAEQDQAVLDLVGALCDCCRASTPAEAQDHMARYQELERQHLLLLQQQQAFFARVDARWPAYTGRFEAALRDHITSLGTSPPPHQPTSL